MVINRDKEKERETEKREKEREREMHADMYKYVREQIDMCSYTCTCI